MSMPGISSQRGLSLVELMISLIISVIISLGVVNFFLQSKVGFQQGEEASRIQENGRWATRYLSRELSMTGFFGSLVDESGISTLLAVVDDCAAGWALSTDSTIEHLNDITDLEAVTAYPCLVNGEVKPGTDIVVVRRAKDSRVMQDGTITGNIENNAVYLRVGSFGASAQLIKGADLTVADKTAGSGVDLWEYQPQMLFIRPYSQSPGDGIPSLCVKKLTRSAPVLALDGTRCLVEGIENLQVEFGVDQSEPLDYAADYYTATPSAADLERAVNARIFILARSINEVAGYRNDKTYKLGATSVGAQLDGHYRRLMQTTVVLRNSAIYGF